MTISAVPPKTPAAVLATGVAPRRGEGPDAGADVGHGPGHRQHRGDRDLHGPGRAGWRGHHGNRRPGGHRRGGDAARGFVRSADQAGTGERRRPVRLFPPRVRRLGRLPRRLVLLGPGLGRQRGHRRVLGLLCRRSPRTRTRVRHGELGDRPARTVGTRDREPGWRPPDGLVPERHRRPQVPPSSIRRCRRLVLRRQEGRGSGWVHGVCQERGRGGRVSARCRAPL